ncbi:MAG: MBL fold metallo-hydrolase [Hyphomicrobiales bacterium]
MNGELRVEFLGTGTSQGVPIIACKCSVCQSFDQKDKRLRSSILVSKGNTQILIDAGPDLRQQMLRANVDSLDAILITHSHMDHIGGIDDVRAFNFHTHKPMDIYALPRDQEVIRSIYSYAFHENPYPGIPRLDLRNLHYSRFQIKDIVITPFRIMHHKMEIAGFKIDDFVYITDGKYIPDASYKVIGSPKVLVINALRKEEHISHFNLLEALQEVEKIKSQVTYFTHISHKFGHHEEIERELPENVHLSYDGLKLQI